jgi:transposase InsO family protein
VPWNERNALDERKSFIEKWHKRRDSFAELCRQFGVARKTGYKWVERFKQGGWPELEDGNRAPRNSPQALAEAQAEEIIESRQQHPNWGARKIREYLKRDKPGQPWPAASTIHALLHRQGLVADRKKRRKTPPYTQPLEHAEAPNQVWCADFKGWFRCGDGVRCDPLTITDAHSRYLLRCRAVSKADGVHARAVFEAVFRQYGVPEAIRTDNGAPFASPAPGGLSRLSMWWLQLGIRHERIDAGHPEQNGRHERMHRTLKAETANPPSVNLRQQQIAFHRFEQEYNYVRPHEALSYQTPSQLYVASAREYPRRLPELEYPCGVYLRRISQQGSLKWKTKRTFISEVLARQTVGLLEVDDDLYEVYYGPLLLGWFEAGAHVFVAEKKPAKARRQTAPDLIPATA